MVASRRIEVEITSGILTYVMDPILDDAHGYRWNMEQCGVTENDKGFDNKLFELDPWSRAIKGRNNVPGELDELPSVHFVKQLSDRYRFSVTQEALEDMIRELDYQETYCMDMRWAGDPDEVLKWNAYERSARSNADRLRAKLEEFLNTEA